MVRYILAGAGLALALAACSPGQSANASAQAPAAAQAARHPVSGLEVIDLTIDRGGRRLPFRVEVADTPEAQARGLMFRTALGDNEGMIFPSDAPEPRSFWMKNTPLSLDIIFIGPDGRILNIAANTVPYSLDSVQSKGAASAVLELRAGRAAALGIVAGDKVSY
ncbi:DUF192 domain-containing protein [Erythrobacter neustonensis]|uniref:DUF192 domain-containing protein n=1 Tax=Erythrobacter neustonensis TaxID=1112 RepID=A0A192D427_9SPHN|nr:DUF192 domain-containing protein [Erythrobacter neustonensis]ANK12662.1 hypothetical protein A9D12_06550 [Erythrobacter neustonensis]